MANHVGITSSDKLNPFISWMSINKIADSCVASILLWSDMKIGTEIPLQHPHNLFFSLGSTTSAIASSAANTFPDKKGLIPTLLMYNKPS